MSAIASRRWRHRHPEAVKEQKRLYYQRHADRLRPRRIAANSARMVRLREEVHGALGGVCARCGFVDWRALHIDHINGGGRADRARFSNREQFLQSVLACRDGYQLLCANCNAIKRIERGEHGTGRPRTIGVIPRSTITED